MNCTFCFRHKKDLKALVKTLDNVDKFFQRLELESGGRF